MKLSELSTLLKQLNIPTTYSHFDRKVSAPYMVYLVDGTQNIFADNKVFEKKRTILIELYTVDKDEDLEEKLEEILNENELPFEVENEEFINSENVFQIVYKITI